MFNLENIFLKSVFEKMNFMVYELILDVKNLEGR